MILHFFEPPPAQKIGGLDAAIRSLEAYLKQEAITVRSNPPLSEIGQSGEAEVGHFHGLWQSHFPEASARCRRLGVPYVVSPHGMLEPWAWRHKWWKKWPYFYARERGHIGRARSLVATGNAEARQLKRFFPTVPCAILSLGLLSARGPDHGTARQSLGWLEDEIVLLYLSRVHPKKGLHLLLQALAELGSSMPMSKVRLVIVGDGETGYVEKLKTLVERERSHLPRVEWIGAVWGEDRWAYFQGADCFCLPSYSENFGLAVLEALQVGTRVLTTTRTPWEALPEWNGGWTSEPEVDEIRRALSEYFSNTDWPDGQRHALAQRILHSFAWQTLGPSYVRFYESMAAKG